MTEEPLNLELLQVLPCHLDGNPNHGNRHPERRMTNRHLLCAGVVGTALAAVCRFTPALVLLLGALGALGVSAWLAWGDFVLLPALVGCVALVAYALYAARRA
jgi:mercuric ion transport protein